jgi:phage gp29-like protein
MTTDSGSSRAQAEVHQDVKLDVIKADADLVCESFSDQVARWLTDWNFPGAAYPKVWREVSEPEDLKARADRDKVIYDMGFKPTQDYVDETYGEGFEPRQVGGQPAAPSGQPPGPGFAEPEREAEQERDDLAEQLEELARPYTDAWLEEIRKVLETSSDFGEAIRRLESMHPDLDVAELARTIGDGLAVANLSGRSDSADDADGV